MTREESMRQILRPLPSAPISPPAKLDRSRWEGCYTCNNTPGIMLGTVTLSIGKQFLATRENEFRFCPHCGRPLTEEAWAELERRIRESYAVAELYHES